MMMDQPPGDSPLDSSQRIAAGALAVATTQTYPAALVATPADSTNNNSNDENTPTVTPAISQPQLHGRRGRRRQQPAIAPHPQTPVALAPMPVQAQTQLSPRHQPTPPPSQLQLQQQQQQPPPSPSQQPPPQFQPPQFQPPQFQPSQFHPYYSLTANIADGDHFYTILAELDPFKRTPKEFINLLVYAATRDIGVGQALARLNSDRIHNPTSWQPLPPPFPGTQPPQPPYFSSEPHPEASTLISYPPNTHPSTAASPSSAEECATSLIHPQKRKRPKAAEQPAAPAPGVSRFRVNCNRMIMYTGPQQQPPPPSPSPSVVAQNAQPQNHIARQIDAAAPQTLASTSLLEQQDVPYAAATSASSHNVSMQLVDLLNNGNDDNTGDKSTNDCQKDGSYVTAT